MLHSRKSRAKELVHIFTVMIIVGSLLVGSIHYNRLGLRSVEADQGSSVTNRPHSSVQLSSYEQMDPILIDGNDELTEFALNESLEGNGSPENPYIIKDYRINGTGFRYSIMISNTNHHFILERIFAHGDIEYATGYGYITLNNVNNGYVDSVIIQSAASRTGIASDLCENITITNSSITRGGFAVNLERCSNLTFTNNYAVTTGHGFWFNQLNRSIIANNTVRSCIRGYYFGEGVDSKFVNNTVDNASNEGFLLADLSHCRIEKNNATDCFNYGYRLAGLDNCSIIDNIANANFREGFYLYNSADCEFIGNSGYDNLHLNDCTNITIADNILIGGRPGCFVESSFNCSFIDNTFERGTYGFLFQDSGNCTLIGNDVINVSEDGILLEQCENFTLMSNVVTNCSNYGFQFANSNNTLIDSNIAYLDTSESILGFYLNVSYDNSILNNVVYSDGRSDFHIESSPGCVLSNNTVYDIVSPRVDHSSNVESFDYLFGSRDRWIRWYANDLLPQNYTITRNGTVVDTGVWTSGNEIFTSVVGLEVGIHIYEIVVSDSSGNTAHDVATFEVLATSTPTTPTTTSTPTSPTSTSPTSTPSPPPPMMTMVLLIGGVGAVVIVLVIVWFKKK